MIRFFFLFLPLLFLCSCSTPTTNRPGIPSVDSYDMREIRQELRKFSYDEATRRRQRLGQIAYNIRRSTGQELCNRKLLPDIGVDFMRINRLTVPKWKSSYDIYREEHEDAQAVYGHTTGEIWIEGVYKNSAAAKAGLQKGDRLISVNGFAVPNEDNAFVEIYKHLQQGGETLPVEIMVERGGKTLKFSFLPDMLCPYYVSVDENAPELNAYANGDNIVVTARMMDYMQDDTALAFVLAHEMSHNVLGHIASSDDNALIGMLLGAAIDFSSGGDGDAMAAGMYIGREAYSKEFEMEADYAGYYLVARAGYDYKRAALAQKMLAAQAPMDIYIYNDPESTHPSSSVRLALARETAKEIDLKLALGDKRSELYPNFDRVNEYLRNKTDITKENSLW